MKLNYKAFLKSIAPFVGTLVAVGVQYLVTKEFDKAEITTAITGITAALLVLIVPNDTDGDGVLNSTSIRLPSGDANPNPSQG